jgi:chromosomal replication initiator protein
MSIVHPYHYAGLVSVKELEKKERVEAVMTVVCDYFSVTREELVSKVRKHNFVRARMFIAYFLKNERNTVELGRTIGNRDHSTIVYYRHQIADYLSIGDREYVRDFNKIKLEINKKHLALTQVLLNE